MAAFAGLAYLVVAIVVSASGTEGSWGGFVLFLLALPLSIISLIVSGYFDSYLFFIILNTSFISLETMLFLYLVRRNR